jgi:uncharacterized protein YccT (UPF0319 family)
MKYLVKANPSRKLDNSDEIWSDTHITKKVNLTIKIKEINHSNDFGTLRSAIVMHFNFLTKASPEVFTVYATQEHVDQAKVFLKEMLTLWEEAKDKCYSDIRERYYDQLKKIQ